MHPQYRPKPRRLWFVIHNSNFKAFAAVATISYLGLFYVRGMKEQSIDESAYRTFDEQSNIISGIWNVECPVADFHSCRSEETVLQYAIRKGVIRRKVSVQLAAYSGRRGLVADESIRASEVWWTYSHTAIVHNGMTRAGGE